MNIFLGNLNFQTTEENIRDLFSDFASLSSVKMIKDKETRRFKGFAFIEIDDESEANDAIEKFNGYELNGRAMVVNEARPQPERKPFNRY